MYNLSSKFGTKVKFEFHNGAYTNKDNTLEIPKMLNLSLSAYYKIFRNFNFTFTLENLLDNKYYYYQNYKAKPFDVLAGFEFRW
jgi:outer membrane receptor protein involved in Fe transport